jgi:hypothetical protein
LVNRRIPDDRLLRRGVGSSNRIAVARVSNGTRSDQMGKGDQQHCRYCGDLVERPRRGQKFRSDRHRYLWHRGQMIWPAKLEERIRAIVKEELARI